MSPCKTARLTRDLAGGASGEGNEIVSEISEIAVFCTRKVAVVMLPALRQPVPEPDGFAADKACEQDAHAQKRSFLRVVSHELRTPLNSILGFSEILASELYGPLGSPQYVEYAAIIRSSGEKLLKLVNQVVEIARLQTGDIVVEMRSEALAPWIDEVLTTFRTELAARELRLVLSFCDEVARTDGRLLRTVLTNLVQNAVRFSPVGGIIRIVTRPAGHRIELVIENEGEGVDASELPRLLRPFEQGDAGLTREGDGAGLGLAISELCCRAISAELRLVSERGRGFAAHICLPRA